MLRAVVSSSVSIMSTDTIAEGLEAAPIADYFGRVGLEYGKVTRFALNATLCVKKPIAELQPLIDLYVGLELRGSPTETHRSSEFH
jgi:hypothetical protein